MDNKIQLLFHIIFDNQTSLDNIVYCYNNTNGRKLYRYAKSLSYIYHYSIFFFFLDGEFFHDISYS